MVIVFNVSIIVAKCEATAIINAGRKTVEIWDRTFQIAPRYEGAIWPVNLVSDFIIINDRRGSLLCIGFIIANNK